MASILPCIFLKHTSLKQVEARIYCSWLSNRWKARCDDQWTVVLCWKTCLMVWKWWWVIGSTACWMCGVPAGTCRCNHCGTWGGAAPVLFNSSIRSRFIAVVTNNYCLTVFASQVLLAVSPCRSLVEPWKLTGVVGSELYRHWLSVTVVDATRSMKANVDRAEDAEKEFFQPSMSFVVLSQAVPRRC